MEVSPKYQMQLIQKIETALWDLYETSKYKNVLHHMRKWQKQIGSWWNNEGEYNFDIKYKEDGNIDLPETLHSITDWELLLKIANDIEVETPWFIPVVSSIKNTLETNYSTAYTSFEKAHKQINEDPWLAVWLANSALESIIKHILDDSRIKTPLNKNDTLFKLTESILKEFGLFPWKNVPEEINLIGSWLIKTAQWIEKIRSEKTNFHWKVKTDNIVSESLYAYFIVNSVTTVWLFLIHFFEANYWVIENENKNKNEKISIDDIPF